MEGDDDDEAQEEQANETPEQAPAKVSPMRQWTLEERLADDIACADKELARRVKERDHLEPLVKAIAKLLCTCERNHGIEDVKLEYFEPGEYGDEQINFRQRIQFSWRVVDYDHRYSNAPDFTITIMGDTLPPSI